MTAGPVLPYAIAAVVFVSSAVALLYVGCVLWLRFERWLADRHRPVNIITFPQRSAKVVPLRKGRDAG